MYLGKPCCPSCIPNCGPYFKPPTGLEHQVPEGLTVFAFPVHQRRKLRTVNLVERLNREVRRRTRVVGIFPSEASCLRLVSAVLMEIVGNSVARFKSTTDLCNN